MYGSLWEGKGKDAGTLNSSVHVRSAKNDSEHFGANDNCAQEKITAASQSPLDEPTDWGIVPRALAELFRVLETKSATGKPFDYSVSTCIVVSSNELTKLTYFFTDCQIMQIYNEKIFDLMQDRKREVPLQLRENNILNSSSSSNTTTASVYVRGLSVYRVYSKEEAFSLLRKGLRNRLYDFVSISRNPFSTIESCYFC